MWKSDLKQFMWDIPLKVFCQANTRRAMKLPPGFRELVMEFSWPESVTLGVVEEFRQEYAYHYNLWDCAMMLITVHHSFVTVVWGIPESIVQHLKKEVSENVLSKYSVTRLKIAGVCVYQEVIIFVCCCDSPQVHCCYCFPNRCPLMVLLIVLKPRSSRCTGRDGVYGRESWTLMTPMRSPVTERIVLHKQTWYNCRRLRELTAMHCS